ncbi:MAG TPA: HDOD domain-containing protein [Thermodesulfobacteriota bacterium]|nr:HDOD domain-containing protein [Thermodesulfobacteriota bacterium]
MNLDEKICQSINQLPPFPIVIQRAMELIENPRSSAQDVVDVIQFDQAITADVLRLCNSAYFGLRRNVDSLREALVMVGFNQLLDIILTRGSVQIYGKPCKGYDLDSGELWRHSVACALLSRIVAKQLKWEAQPAHFTAALLHDIGKMVLSDFVKDYLKDIQNLIETRQVSFIDAEREVLGIDHAELGGKITDQWKFPKTIVSAVRYHHSPSLAQEDHQAVQLVYLCDVIAMITGIGGGADGLSYPAYGEVMKQYNLKEEDIERFIVQLDDRFHLVDEVLRAK